MYQNAAKGLKFKFIGELVTIACAIIMIVPLLGTILGMYGMLACYIISIYGLYLVSNDIPGCRTAFIVSIVNTVFMVARLFSGNLWFMGTISSVISFLALFLVCKSLSEDLREHGMLEIADRGETVWKINLICSAISIVVSIMMYIPLINLIGALLGAVNALASVVGSVLYFIFLYKSYKFYEAY
ncbi:MAG: hypothetical protein IK152_06395 [Lachnospiraceae bacterium]|nr:hypothetical protein [Lachnospiraceae bacterium]